MQLYTARLHLRPVITSDADALFRIFGDPATNTFNPAGPYPDTHYAQNVLADWVSHWENYHFGVWAVSLKDNPEKIIGFGGLSVSSYAGISVNSLGYRFSPESWGKGLATEFARYMIGYGFDKIKLPEISAVVRANHLASQKVLTNSGLRYAQDIHDVKNAPASMLFTLTRVEWNKNRDK